MKTSSTYEIAFMGVESPIKPKSTEEYKYPPKTKNSCPMGPCKECICND